MSNKPTHFLNIVNGEGRSAIFTRICGLWETSSGGLSGTLPAGVTIGNARIVITEARAASSDSEGGAQ